MRPPHPDLNPEFSGLAMLPQLKLVPLKLDALSSPALVTVFQMNGEMLEADTPCWLPSSAADISIQ